MIGPHFVIKVTLHWRHNWLRWRLKSPVSRFLLNRLFKRRSKKTSKLCVRERGIHRWQVNSPLKGPVTRKTFPFDDVIMILPVLGIIFIRYRMANMSEKTNHQTNAIDSWDKHDKMASLLLYWNMPLVSGITSLLASAILILLIEHILDLHWQVISSHDIDYTHLFIFLLNSIWRKWLTLHHSSNISS